MEPTVAESKPNGQAEIGPPFVCPACLGGLRQTETTYDCAACAQRYPIIHDIPDFRLLPDRFLSIGEDRAKASRLIETASDESVPALLDAYYALTPEMPKNEAERYRIRQQAEDRVGELTWREIEGNSRKLAIPARGTPMLDLGCGTAGLVVSAARRGLAATGLDVALRRLIIARARLRAAGVGARLVCANAEHLPFADASFGVATAVDLLEHVAESRQVLSECRRVIATNGTVYIAGNNRYSAAPEPHVRLWGVGFLPRRLRSHYGRSFRGHAYDRVNLLSAGDMSRGMREAGFPEVTVAPGLLFAEHLGPWSRRLASIYNSLRSRPLTRTVLRVCAPRIQCTARGRPPRPNPQSNE